MLIMKIKRYTKEGEVSYDTGMVQSLVQHILQIN